MDKQTDGMTDQSTGWTDGRIDRGMNGWTDSLINQLDRWMDGWMT